MKKTLYTFASVVFFTAAAIAQSIQWQNTIGGSNWDKLYSLKQTSDGGYILGGESLSNISGDKTENSQGYYDYWVVKLDIYGGMEENTLNNLHIFPNPTGSSITVEFPEGGGEGAITLYNIAGKEVAHSSSDIRPCVPTYEQQAVISMKELPAGIYFIQAEINGKRFSYRVVRQ